MALRPWVRALHRDTGYLAVGLTCVYALSGLAVNHLADWDPNFQSQESVHQLPAPLPASDEEASRAALQLLGIQGEEPDAFRNGQDLQLTLERHTIHVDMATGRVTHEEQKPRLLLHVANWLHLNRGKRAWTWIADLYAGGLLFLALSGMFMLPGRKGLLGRGAILVLLGAAIPVVYVWTAS